MLKRYNYRTKLLKHSFSLIAYGNANIKFESFSGLEYKRTVKRATYPSHAGRTHTKFHVYNNFIFDTGHSDAGGSQSMVIVFELTQQLFIYPSLVGFSVTFSRPWSTAMEWWRVETFHSQAYFNDMVFPHIHRMNSKLHGAGWLHEAYIKNILTT